MGVVTSVLLKRDRKMEKDWQAKVFGKYRIEKLLGESRYTKVFQVHHVELGSTLALKVFSAKVTSGVHGAKFLDILHHNAELGAQIHHPNIVQIYESGLARKTFYVVMEIIVGKTVGQILQEVGRIDPADALYIVKQVALGLNAGHERQLLHLNIQPSNIFITNDEQIKLADFGLALPIEHRGFARKEIVTGNPLYIAPEYIEGNKKIDCRADIYSLGATLFHLLTGAPPYQSRQIADLFEQHLSVPVPSVLSANADIPRNVDKLLAMMMAKRSQHRVASGQELGRVLDEFVIEVKKPESNPSTITDAFVKAEEFLLNKLAQSPEDRIHIKEMLEAIAGMQQEEDIPEEAQELMEQIIVEEFGKQLGCPAYIIDILKQRPDILQNPKKWVDAQVNRINSNSEERIAGAKPAIASGVSLSQKQTSPQIGKIIPKATPSHHSQLRHKTSPHKLQKKPSSSLIKGTERLPAVDPRKGTQVIVQRKRDKTERHPVIANETSAKSPIKATERLPQVKKTSGTQQFTSSPQTRPEAEIKREPIEQESGTSKNRKIFWGLLLILLTILATAGYLYSLPEWRAQIDMYLQKFGLKP